jgi:hypothetical protein
MSRIAPADRPSIQVADDILEPRNKFAAQTGISERTIARKLKRQTKIIGGVAYVFVEASKRELAGLNPRSHKRSRATA